MKARFLSFFNFHIKSRLYASASKYLSRERNSKLNVLKPTLTVLLAITVLGGLGGILLTNKGGTSHSASASITALKETEQTIPASVAEPAPVVEKERLFHTIKSGETLGTIMHLYGFDPNLPYNIVRTENGEQFKRIRVGKILEFVMHKTTYELEEIRYPLSTLESLVATIQPESLINVGVKEVPHTITQKTANATIEYSLFGAASEAGISDNMIMELAEIFGWDVDFVRDIRTGDSFKVIYEQYLGNNGAVLKEGNILAAEFTNKQEKYTAIRYEQDNGEIGYFAPDGSSMKGTFLKSPMRFSRVSSGFSRKRFHPILKKWRSHKGVDYAARTGTPIRSVANGKVIFRGTKGGYGRTIVLSHGGKYTTLYAHMSKYSSTVRSGSAVKQGQIIGYVGATGLATGPHLHYEFRVNGIHRNPLTYKTPKATSVAKAELAKFSSLAEQQLAALDKIKISNNLIAQTE